MGQITDKAEQALERAEALGDELNRIFVQLDKARILADAAKLDANKSFMEHLPFYGMTVSLKDLFDESGQVTTAGSRVLQGNAPARHDCVVVARLKAAGVLLFGRTSMSEFAYSGLGMNPHHGTPGCIFDRTLIPGGSSSGAALSVAHGLCDIAMGTDTGGSVRLPAAVNGLYGFKPSAHTVPTVGVYPLSTTYDSVGPLATSYKQTVDCLNVIRDKPLAADSINRPLKLLIPEDTFTDDMDPTVADEFNQQVSALKAAGHSIESRSFDKLIDWTTALRMTVSYETRTFHSKYLKQLESQGDPHVLARIHQSADMTDTDLAYYQQQRQEAITWFNDRLDGFDALLAPTIKCERPTIEAARNDFNTHNAAVLRNTTYINLINGCGLSIPVARAGLPPAALMVCGPNNHDDTVLSAGYIIDACLNSPG